MAGEKILTLRLEGGLRGKLDKLAAATWRSRSFLAAEAIREYVALNSWQIEEIHEGLAEAERGEFASESEVKRVARKWALGNAFTFIEAHSATSKVSRGVS